MREPARVRGIAVLFKATLPKEALSLGTQAAVESGKCTEAAEEVIIFGFALPHCYQAQQVASTQKEYACVITKSFC